MQDPAPMEGDTISYVIFASPIEDEPDLRPFKTPLSLGPDLQALLAHLEGAIANKQILQNSFKINQTNTTQTPLLPDSDPTLGASLSEQFKWGAVVSVGVFVIVFACILTAYWVHKKQQEFMRSRIEDLERRRAGPASPFIISSLRTESSQGIDNAALQLPPPYLEVVSIPIERDPPPSYVEAIKHYPYKAVDDGQVTEQAASSLNVMIMPPVPPYSECSLTPSGTDRSCSALPTDGNTPATLDPSQLSSQVSSP